MAAFNEPRPSRKPSERNGRLHDGLGSHPLTYVHGCDKRGILCGARVQFRWQWTCDLRQQVTEWDARHRKITCPECRGILQREATEAT